MRIICIFIFFFICIIVFFKYVGWNGCADFIKKIISPYRISRQIVPIVTLAQYLQDFDCVEGAKMVESWILSILSAGNQSLAQRNRDVRVAELFHLFTI